MARSSSASRSASSRSSGLIVLSQLVDPIFGRYAVLLSVIAGVFELVPIIGPIISAVPAVLLAATAGPVAVVAALVLYLLVQQVENNFLVPKIQGDAVELHPAVVMFAIIVGGSLAGLLGAILALPVTAAFRDVVRYLFRRLSPGRAARRWRASLDAIGMGPRRCLTAIDPYKVLQVDSEAEDEVIQAAYRRLARKYHPDLAATPEAAARMAAINAAWELIGDPARGARTTSRARGRGDARRGRGAPAAAGAASAPTERAGVRPPTAARRARRPPPPPESCRATGRRAARPRAAASTSRCARPRARRRRAAARPTVGHASSTSGATPAGRSARSPARTSSTSNGSTGCRSGGTTATSSTRSCAGAAGASRADAEAADRRGLFRRR